MRYNNIFMLGGAGFVGSEVVETLRSAGYRVGVLAKEEDEAARLNQQGIETYVGDITDEAQLIEVLRTFQPDALVHLVGIIKEVPPAVTFERIHVGGTKAAVAAAKTVGLKKIIYISALGANPHGSTAYFTTKAAAEKVVLESGIAYTIFRPSPMFGKKAGFTGELAGQIRRLPFVPVVGTGIYPFQVVAVSVTAHCIAKALETPASDGKIYDVVGPETLTLEEVMRRLMQKLNIHKHVAHIPLFLMKLIASAGRIGIPVPITRDQLTMLVEGSVGNVEAMQRDFNPPKITFDPKGSYPLF